MIPTHTCPNCGEPVYTETGHQCQQWAGAGAAIALTGAVCRIAPTPKELEIYERTAAVIDGLRAQLAEAERKAARWAEVEAMAAGGAAVLVEHDGEGLVAHRLHMPSGHVLATYQTAPAGKGRQGR